MADLVQAARTHGWAKGLAFDRYPEVTVVQPPALAGPADRTLRLAGESYVVPAAVAAWAMQPAHNWGMNLRHRPLERVLHGMGLSER